MAGKSLRRAVILALRIEFTLSGKITTRSLNARSRILKNPDIIIPERWGNEKNRRHDGGRAWEKSSLDFFHKFLEMET